MTLPTSTYRIQFRDGMTFDRAVEIVPYLQRLGISHLYASPIFTATSGSTHGYDVTDANEIDPAIGGRAGFDRLSSALKSAGIGMLLDIVPNHMAASLENGWWRDVVEWGQESPFGDYFDIDWTRRLTIPTLGKPLAEAIEDGELQIVADTDAGCLAVAYYDQKFPLSPRSYGMLPPFPQSDAIRALAEKATTATAADFHTEMKAILKPSFSELEQSLAALSADRDLLRRVLDAQPWELIYWRDGPNRLSYRRFFEVTGLVGLRVEDAGVFDDAHRLVLELVNSGAVDGLRLDHIDGLADPAAYLDRLRKAVGDDIYIVVEKIVAEGESLPEAWPISGTTGYEFIKSLANLLIDTDGMQPISTAYKAAAPSEPGFVEGVHAVKAMLARKNFAVETGNLLALLTRAAEIDGAVVAKEKLERALVALLVACPVYRTYGTAEGLAPDDDDMWKGVVQQVAASATDIDEQALGFIDRLFRGEVAAGAEEIVEAFRRRFQQLTGPLTAKSVEDTMFYRYNRLLSLNEVGGEPAAEEFSVAAFHDAMIERAGSQPQGITTTSTHDTKRGEDTRARLHALSEDPAGWKEAVARWHAMNAEHVQQLPEGSEPEPAVEWMIYEALAGAWPADLAAEAPIPEDLQPRFLAYIEKALREAKQRTNWGEEDEAYEKAVAAFARHLLSPDGKAFQADFRKTLQPLIRAGLFNSLTQTLAKLVAPGIPDIYQGAEQLDLSLVDPDNRRMPDYQRLSRDLAAPLSSRDNAALAAGIVKQHLVAKGLRLRQVEPALFASGAYSSVKIVGDRSHNAVAFSRSRGEKLVVAVAPRLVYKLEADAWPCGAYWGNTAIMLPGNGRPWTLRNLLDNRTYQATNRLDLAALLQDQPVALLISQP